MKKSSRVSIRDFARWIQHLNGHLDLLPCLYCSSKTVMSMKAIGHFDYNILVSHILRLFPRNWQEQYELSRTTVQQSVKKFLEAMECIKKAYPTNEVYEVPKSSTKPRNSLKMKTVFFNERISKIHRQEKHCLLCKQNSCPHKTYSTP